MLLSQVSAFLERSLDGVFENVAEVVYADFPDYPNVGDSALSLGMWDYFERRGIAIASAYAVTTLSDRVYDSFVPVVMSGGGSLGGLYPPLSDHRYKLAERLRSETVLVQAPQSLHFVSKDARKEFVARMCSRGNLELMVRDTHSSEELVAMGVRHRLVPDTIHALGGLNAREPRARVVALLRRDGESQVGVQRSSVDSVDWLEDPWLPSVRTWLRWRTWHLGPMRSLFNSSVDGWESAARLRLARGLEILSEGEIVVTDRLHGMLLGLLIGRRVVAIDNANGKLSRYAATWLEGIPELRFAENVSEALRLASAD